MKTTGYTIIFIFSSFFLVLITLISQDDDLIIPLLALYMIGMAILIGVFLISYGHERKYGRNDWVDDDIEFNEIDEMFEEEDKYNSLWREVDSQENKKDKTWYD